jgi:hypothetical protein
MTQIATANPEATKAAPGAPRIRRLRNFLLRAVIGAALGGILGYFLVKGEISGTAVGAVLGCYLARGIFGAIAGAALGFFFIDGASGTAAGMVVGTMISCNIVGRKGRVIVLAIVVAIAVFHILQNPTWRKQALGLFGIE